MDLKLTVDDQKWNWLLSKAAQENSNPLDLLDFKINEFLDACGRDVGADDLSKVQAALSDPAKLATAKSALGIE